MKRVRLSDEALCAKDTECCSQKNRKKWVEQHDLFVGSDGRAYALVDTNLHVYFMDAVTGGLIHFGELMSGDRIVTRMTRDHRKATKILMNAFMEDEVAA